MRLVHAMVVVVRIVVMRTEPRSPSDAWSRCFSRNRSAPQNVMTIIRVM